MFNVVLYQPEIPPNTGNIIRLCAVTGCSLHLIKPLGFQIDDKQLKRAGLDYELQIPLILHENIQEYFLSLDNFKQVDSKEVNSKKSRIFLCSTKAKTNYSKVEYKAGDSFIFGPETRGLPKDLLDGFPEQQKIKIPMLPNSRSLNLANSVAIIVYEAWRQQDFNFL